VDEVTGIDKVADDGPTELESCNELEEEYEYIVLSGKTSGSCEE
jgi:hypothetical protein